MRFPSFPSVILALHALTKSPKFRFVSRAGELRGTTLKSMPTFPLLASLFSSSSSSADKMSFPVEKSKDEWQAVLNKGSSSILSFSIAIPLFLFPSPPASITSRTHRPLV